MEEAPVIRIPESPTSEEPSSLGGGRVEEMAKYLPGALNAIEKKPAISFSLVSIIGYIVIAAFGKMDTLGKYFGYLLFLALCLSAYKLLTTKITVLVGILIVVAILLSGFILYEHGFFTWVVNRI